MPGPHDRRSALALSDAGGHGRVALVGLASAIVGQLIIAAAEVIWPSNRDLGDVLFSVSPILTGAGLVTAGVAIIRAGVWARPSRFLPLTLGLYTISREDRYHLALQFVRHHASLRDMKWSWPQALTWFLARPAAARIPPLGPAKTSGVTLPRSVATQGLESPVVVPRPATGLSA